MGKRSLSKPGFTALLFLLGQTNGLTYDGANIEILTGNHTQVLRGTWRYPLFIEDPSSELQKYKLSWEWSFGYWQQNRPENAMTGTRSLVDAGLTPIFRWSTGKTRCCFAEAGIGMHWLSQLYDNNGRQFSTRLQFASHVSAGYRLPQDFALSIRAEHISNGGIRHPNPGVNLIGIQFGKTF